MHAGGAFISLIGYVHQTRELIFAHCGAYIDLQRDMAGKKRSGGSEHHAAENGRQGRYVEHAVAEWRIHRYPVKRVSAHRGRRPIYRRRFHSYPDASDINIEELIINQNGTFWVPGFAGSSESSR